MGSQAYIVTRSTLRPLRIIWRKTRLNPSNTITHRFVSSTLSAILRLVRLPSFSCSKATARAVLGVLLLLGPPLCLVLLTGCLRAARLESIGLSSSRLDSQRLWGL